jgi:hypothetical protein
MENLVIKMRNREISTKGTESANNFGKKLVRKTRSNGFAALGKPSG